MGCCSPNKQIEPEFPNGTYLIDKSKVYFLLIGFLYL